MLFGLNIRRAKGLTWILNIGAILCITLVFIIIYKKKERGEFLATDWKTYQGVLEAGKERKSLESRITKIDINDYAAIWNAPLSGIKKVAVADTGTDETVLATGEPIEEVLSIIGILKAKDPEDSLVRLEYLKATEDAAKSFKLEVWSKEGDSLKSPYDVHPYYGKILKIEDRKVNFSFEGKEVSLTPLFLGKKDGDEKEGDGKEAAQAASDYTPPEESTEVKPNYWHISPKETKYVTKNWEKELNYVTLASVRNPATGRTQLKVTQIQENSLAQKRGFKTGDTLVSINGVPVHTKAGAINYVKDHPNEGTYTVVVNRLGRNVTKTFVVPKE